MGKEKMPQQLGIFARILPTNAFGTGRKTRVTDSGSTVLPRTRCATRGMAYLSHQQPSLKKG